MTDNIVEIIKALAQGDATLGLITLLLFMVAGLTFAVVKLWKHNQEQHANFRAVTKEYSDNILQVMNESHQRQKITEEAMKDVQLVLMEMKGKIG